MLALVQAAGLVNPHPSGKPRLFGQLLQPRVQVALSVHSAGTPRRTRRTGIMTNKYVMFEAGQVNVLLVNGFSQGPRLAQRQSVIPLLLD
jgi:hypothetical protein